MTSVLIWAADTGLRDGIARLLEEMPALKVVGVAEDEAALVRFLEAGRVDLVVADAGAESASPLPRDLAEEVPIVALVTAEADAVRALRTGARAALLRPAGRAEMAAAIQAVEAGLSLVPAELLADLLRTCEVGNPRFGTHTLTPRELEVLALMAAGASNKMIARRLDISVHTAKFHVAAVLDKLGAHSRAEAVALAARHGLVLL